MACDDVDIYHLPLLTKPSFMMKSNLSAHIQRHAIDSPPHPRESLFFIYKMSI